MIGHASPHKTLPRSTERVMGWVLLALIPGTLVMLYSFGIGVLINLTLCIATGVLTEWSILRVRGRDPRPAIKDLSGVVACALLGLSLPPLAPFWIAVLGAVLTVGLAKQLFGGLGHNPFNPAMVAYATLLISFPIAMSTTWVDPTQTPSWSQSLSAQFMGADGYSGATPLDRYKDMATRFTEAEIRQDSVFGGSLTGLWTWLAAAWLVGGIIMIVKRITYWHAPVGLLIGIALPAGVFGYDSDQFVPLSLHLTAGATVFAAFFIVTDPVSGATSPRGRLAFGFGAGLLTWIIRTYGGYPDAVAFGVLLMNLCAPLLDQYTRPKIYGHKAARRGPVLEKRS